MVGSLSHDLRSPVNGIVLLLEIIKRQVPDELLELIEPALYSCKHLLSLIDDVIQLTKEDLG